MQWWKVVEVFKEESAVAFNKAVTSFQSYTENVRSHIIENSPLKETLAIIAFQPYGRKSDPEGMQLTVSSMAATMASLIKVGFGRIVIVGLMSEMENDFVKETFRCLRLSLDADETSAYDALNDTTMPISRIGQTEIGYAQAHPEECKSKHAKSNIPRGALFILQQAFKGNLDPTRMHDVFGSTTDKSYWKYIYLTEPDMILQTKPLALPTLKRALDEGLNLFPHRLQPLPHESDFIGMKNDRFFVNAKGNFSTVLNLDSLDRAACCDEQMGKYKPFHEYFYPNCGRPFWWMCGFHDDKKNHSHLEPYPLMRLQQGTGIVSLAATEHGRRCVPKINGACTPRTKDIA